MSGGFGGGDGGNPWGEEDIRYGSPEELRETVAIIKKDYERYRRICHLQYQFMDSFEELPGDVYRTTFSDGSVLTCDLKSGEMKLEKRV
jgi:hypothetical protein